MNGVAGNGGAIVNVDHADTVARVVVDGITGNSVTAAAAAVTDQQAIAAIAQCGAARRHANLVAADNVAAVARANTGQVYAVTGIAGYQVIDQGVGACAVVQADAIRGIADPD